MIQQHKITIYFEFSIIIENIIKIINTPIFILLSRGIIIGYILLRLFVCCQENAGWRCLINELLI